MEAEYLPVLIYFFVALGLVLIFVFLSTLLGDRRPSTEKSRPYECGNLETVPFRGRFSVKFYLVAMLFLLFDVEVVFFYPWAVVFRDLGWSGLAAMGVFLFILLYGYFYAWKRGAFEWY